MNELDKLRAKLKQSSNAARALKLADDYLLELARKKEDFILPRAHASLLPILEAFADDLSGWRLYLKALHDKVEARMYQRISRSLSTLARDVAIKKGILPDTPADKERYIKRCRKLWDVRKKTMLSNARKMAPKNRLSESHRAELLADYWERLEEELNNGEVPKP